MINPRDFTAAFAIALALAMASPGAGYAEYKANGSVRPSGGARPMGNLSNPGPAVVAAPSAGAMRSGVQAPQPSGVYRGGYHGGYRDRDRDRDRGGFVAGAVAGAIIGGALVTQPYDYSGGPGIYEYDGGPAAVSDDALAYCLQTYPSYDPQSGTYLGNDGYRYPCP